MERRAGSVEQEAESIKHMEQGAERCWDNRYAGIRTNAGIE